MKRLLNGLPTKTLASLSDGNKIDRNINWHEDLTMPFNLIDTKVIRRKLMLERKFYIKDKHQSDDPYYDGVMDALTEVEKIQTGKIDD